MTDWWSGFERDPRDAGNAGLRASDADRDVLRGLLSEAFADGRLDREEFDERTDQLLRARTLGDLPPIVRDLVSMTPAVPRPAGLMSPDELQAKAVERWRSDRREARLRPDLRLGGHVDHLGRRRPQASRGRLS